MSAHGDSVEAALQRLSIRTPALRGPAAERPGMNLLPPELLSQIFVEVCRVFVGVETGWSAAPILNPQAPFDLSLVCQLWNELVLSAPVLWSSFILNLDAEACLVNVEGFMDRFLRLSKSHPLNVGVIQTTEGTLSLDLAEKLKSKILSSSDRITSLEVASAIDPFAFYTKPILFPNLTHYHHLQARKEDSDGFLWLRSPRLRNVRLLDGTLNDSIRLALYTVKITTLSLRTHTLDQAFSLIRAHSPYLEVLILQMDCLGRDPGTEFAGVHLDAFDNLKEIYVDCTFNKPQNKQHDDVYPSLFASLTAPSLQILRVTDDDSEDPGDSPRIWNQKIFADFIDRSNISHKLTVLLTCTSFITDSDLISAFGKLPHLEVLSVVDNARGPTPGCPTSLALLAFLTPAHPSPLVEIDSSSEPSTSLPHLKILRLSIPGLAPQEFEERMEAIVLLVERRIMPSVGYTTLLALDLWLDAALEGERISSAMARLDACRKMGLKLKVPQLDDVHDYGSFQDMSAMRRMLRLNGIPYGF